MATSSSAAALRSRNINNLPSVSVTSSRSEGGSVDWDQHDRDHRDNDDDRSNGRGPASSQNDEHSPRRQSLGSSVAGSSSDAAASSSSAKHKAKANPLMDLIKTENLYVEDMGVIIQKAAAAWSRNCLPPPELDAMFRAAEAIYRVNKGLLVKLNEIGPTPASPKKLGDLLMHWIPEIDPSYTRYLTLLSLGFDDFHPVRSNAQVATTLARLSWPATLPLPEREEDEIVTMDVLFELPGERIRYYKRLYAKLLKSTQEGKSDHVLLVRANEKLDVLLLAMERARSRRVGDTATAAASSASMSVSTSGNGKEREDEEAERRNREVLQQSVHGVRDSTTTSDSSLSSRSGRDRSSASSSSAVTTPAMSGSGSPRIEDLEKRLCTDRALDIFTMLPKKCKLQMVSPTLTFIRSLRRSSDVVISFYPSSDPTHREVIIHQACIFLLTDLFLVCAHMTPAERITMNAKKSSSSAGEEAADMWLLYPPLAGKHLRVEQGEREGELEVTVMKREKLTIRLEGKQAAREWKLAFEEAIRFGVDQGASARANSTSTAASLRDGRPLLAPLATNYPTSLQHDARSGSATPLALATGRLSANSTARSFVPDVPLKGGSLSLGLPRRNGSTNSAPFSPSGYSPMSAIGVVRVGGERRGSADSRAASYNEQQQQQQQPSASIYGGNNVAASQSTTSELSSQSGIDQLQQGGSDYRYNNSNPNTGDYSEGGWSDHHQQQHQQQQQYLNSNSNNYGSGSSSIGRSRSAEGLQRGGSSSNHPYRLPNPSFLTGSDRSGSAPNSTYGDGRSIGGSRHTHNGNSYGNNNNGGGGNDYYANGSSNSPPPTPVLDKDTTAVIAQMRCKVFFQQHHAQWKSLGTARLKLFLSSPSNTKQLVVESEKEKGDKKTFVSTIVLTDGVEKVGKTGVAIELSDRGVRTGIVYMLQMKTEQAAQGLFDQLLLGSDRGGAR